MFSYVAENLSSGFLIQHLLFLVQGLDFEIQFPVLVEFCWNFKLLMESYRRGGLVTLSPSGTPPRPSEKTTRSGESNLSGKQDKDRGVNVQVLLRCR